MKKKWVSAVIYPLGTTSKIYGVGYECGHEKIEFNKKAFFFFPQQCPKCNAKIKDLLVDS